MIDNIIEIQKNELQTNVQRMSDEGYRFITITCITVDEGFELIYHFGKDYEMQNFRLKVSKDEEVESISKIYFCSLLVENEIKDLFGINIKNIIIDYNGKLLLSEGAPYAPMSNKGQIEIEVRG